MSKFNPIIIVGILLLGLPTLGFAFWFGGPGSYVDIPLPQEAIPRSPGAPKSTDTVYVLVADSFFYDQGPNKGQPTKVQGANFSHGEGVYTKMVQTFQEIAQGNPELGSTLLILSDGQQPFAIYDANGPVTDSNIISQYSKHIVVVLADIPGEELIEVIDEKTGEKTGEKKWTFSGDAVYKTLVNALETLKKMEAAVVVNLSMSTKQPAPALEDLMRTYGNTLFFASSDGYPGNYAETLSNVVAVGNADSGVKAGNNTVYAEGKVTVNGETVRGSSFAVPQVVIVAALAWQQNSNINSTDVRNIIVEPTLEVTADAQGILNPQASLEMARSYTPSTPIFGSSPLFGNSPFGFIW